MREQKSKEEEIKNDMVIVVDKTDNIKGKTSNNEAKIKEI